MAAAHAPVLRCDCRVKSRNAGRPGLPRADARYLLSRLQVGHRHDGAAAAAAAAAAARAKQELQLVQLKVNSVGKSPSRLADLYAMETASRTCRVCQHLGRGQMPTRLAGGPAAAAPLLLLCRQKGFIPLSTYLTTYKLGDYVDVKVNGAVHKVQSKSKGQ